MDEKELLICMYQNTGTALQSIDDLIKKSKDAEFNKLLNAQYKRYEKYNNELEDYAQKNGIELKENNWLEKVKLWSSIQMGTMTDNSTRHLAELMLTGTVMGTVNCYKARVDYKDASKEALELLDKLENMEEDNFNELKKYLKR